MADDKKSDSSQAPSSASPGLPAVIDDWDSLPLEPDDDDWDDLPPPKSAPPPSPDSTSLPAAPIPAAAPPPSPTNLPPGAAPPPDSGQIFDLLGSGDEFKVDDFGDQFDEAAATGDLKESAAPEDGRDVLDLSGGLDPDGSLSPEATSAGTQIDDLDFDDILSAANEAKTASAGAAARRQADEADDLKASDPENAAEVSDSPDGSDGSEAGEEDSDPDLFDAHLGASAFLEGEDGPTAGPGPAAGRDSISIMDKIEAELEDLPTKKVELDIDGIFLEDHDPPPPFETEAPPPEPQEEPEPPLAAPSVPEELPAPKKIPRIKLLMLLVPALLLVCGLGFGIYKLFLAPAPAEGPAPLVIDPTVPPREPQPGSLDMGAFYVNFPGERGETIIEMTVVLYYKDLPDRAAIEARLPLVRDVIYLLTQGQGSQVISNGESQRLLRQAAAEQANAILGGDHIDYVQISQIRILQ